MVRKKISKRRRLLFTCVTLVILWGIFECLAFAGMKLFSAEYSFASFRDQRNNLIAGMVSDGAAEVIHPYIGWCMNPAIAKPDHYAGREIPINRWGLIDDNDSVVQRSDEHLIVGIAGGSVAWQMSVAGESELRKILEASPKLQGRKLRLVRMAVSGFKQPQQLMLLNYLISLGGEFDVVVNIDGYNEAALSIAENSVAGVTIAYPRSWHSRTFTMQDPRESAASARLLRLRGQRQSMAMSLSNSIWQHSALANLIWKARDTSCQNALTQLGYELSRSTRPASEKNFASYGPIATESEIKNINQRVIDLWLRSAHLMQHTCVGHGAKFVHILQPNQYHAGSKVLTKDEKARAISDYQLAGEVIRDIYPDMIAAGKTLSAAGIQFSDQTQIFADVAETVYADEWCHVNELGNRLLARAVATQILQSLP